MKSANKQDINILFVDDEPYILSSLNRFLAKESFIQFYAENSDQAIDIIEKNTINIIVSDMKMPGLDGLQLLLWVKKHHPDIIRIVMSAYTQPAQIIPCINNGEIFRFITKPLYQDDLKHSIRDAIEWLSEKSEKNKLAGSLKSRSDLLLKTLKERRVLGEKLRTLSIIDELTGLYGHQHILPALENEVNRCTLLQGDFSCLLLKLNVLEKLNNTFHSTYRRALLQEFASIVKSHLECMDMAFRYEFRQIFVLLPEKNIEEALCLGEKIRNPLAINSLFNKKESEAISIDIGASSFLNTQPVQADELMTAAESCLKNEDERMFHSSRIS